MAIDPGNTFTSLPRRVILLPEDFFALCTISGFETGMLL